MNSSCIHSNNYVYNSLVPNCREIDHLSDQFGELRRNISEKIERRRKIATEINSYNMFRIWRQINDRELIRKNRRCKRLRNCGYQETWKL